MSQPSHEFTGKTTEEAIEKGLAELGLVRDAVDVQILNEGSRGFLGLGGEGASVRLTPHAVVPTSAPAVAVSSDDAHKLAQDTLQTLLQGMGIPSHVEIQKDESGDDPNAIILNIVGHDLGVLIGRRGETLHDLEFLTRLLVSHRANQPVKLTVDVEGYRTRRERMLRELAKRMSERVQTNKQPITLEAMPPNERRIIHITLRDHPTVTTHSIGEGEHRRVMIIPK